VEGLREGRTSREERIRMSVAGTILQQLGGNRFAAMTGARELVAGPNSLRFRIGRNASRIGIVKVVLNGRDLYDMSFYRRSGEVVNEEEDVYAEDLGRIFTANTGMYTTL
jgi:hypothetical protein